jgi:hypothetical protein
VSGPERAIRWSTIAAVAAVAGVAGWVSYEHALAVVRAHGETGAVAQVYPVTVDGLIYSASMVLLDAARRQAAAPVLARWLLGAGIGATLAANVAAGLHYGPVGAIVAAWPALALVGSYELLMLIIRSGTRAEHPVPGVPASVPEARAALNGHAGQAERIFAADIAAGNVPGIRRIRSALHVGQPKAEQVRAYLASLAEAAHGTRAPLSAPLQPAQTHPSAPGDAKRDA